MVGVGYVLPKVPAALDTFWGVLVPANQHVFPHVKTAAFALHPIPVLVHWGGEEIAAKEKWTSRWFAFR